MIPTKEQALEALDDIASNTRRGSVDLRELNQAVSTLENYIHESAEGKAEYVRRAREIDVWDGKKQIEQMTAIIRDLAGEEDEHGK